MLLRLDPTDGLPLYEQIASAIRLGLRSGEIAEGDRLPPARELASVLDVNMHTVLRAYSSLSDEGVVEMRRGRGSVIRSGGPHLAILTQMVADVAREGRRQGLGVDDVVGLIKTEMA